jgi:hypothetical protein
VADAGNERIQKLWPVGQRSSMMAWAGRAKRWLSQPAAIALGSVVVMLVGGLAPGGHSLAHSTVGSRSAGSRSTWQVLAVNPNWPTPPIHSTEFAGIAVDRRGDVYVADSGNNRIFGVEERDNLMQSAVAGGLTSEVRGTLLNYAYNGSGFDLTGYSQGRVSCFTGVPNPAGPGRSSWGFNQVFNNS